MSGKLTHLQRMQIRKKSKPVELDPSEMAGELNIVPFLDILVNLIMFLLMTTAAVAAFAQLEARLPQYSAGVGGRGAKDKALDLHLMVVERGVIVSGSNGKLAPGCKNTLPGRVVTVAKDLQGKYNWQELKTCLELVKKQFPDERQVIIGADPLIEYASLIRTMDTARGTGESELFPDILLSAGVR